MTSIQLTYQDYINRVSMYDLLSDGGYKLNRRDGMKYPCFVRLDNDGRRIRGDKFVVTNEGRTCFHPPVMRTYNAISLIKEFPEMFKESTQGYSGDRLVNAVCRRILNMPPEHEEVNVNAERKQIKPFDINDYSITRFNNNDRETFKTFYPYFKRRGISLMTESMFKKHFFVASTTDKNGNTFTNLSFPLRIPGKPDIVGLEQRARTRLDGTCAYKGKAPGSNGSEGLWIASADKVNLKDAKHVYWFESAYDALAYFQTHVKKDFSLYKSILVSTGGTPTVAQMKGMLKETPDAKHHLCFDNDMAGRQFVKNFYDTAMKMCPLSVNNVPEDMKEYVDSFRFIPIPDGKDTYNNLTLEYEPLSIDTKVIGFVKDMVPTPKQIIYDAFQEEHFKHLPDDLQQKCMKMNELADHLAYVRDDSNASAVELTMTSDAYREAKDDFKNSLFERLNIDETTKAGLVDMVREVPESDYKDWKEELFIDESERRGGKLTTTFDTGLDLDGDGEDDLIEQEQNIEEKKHQHHGKHF